MQLNLSTRHLTYLITALLSLCPWEALAQLEVSRISTVNLPGLTLSAISLEDLNGDGHRDILMSGVGAGENRSIRFYLGNGLGTFSVNPISNIPALSEGSISVGDLDGDGDPDLLMTGSTTNGYLYAETNLFLNDGTGNFTRSTRAGLEALDQSESLLADVDGDADLDLLLTGVDTTNVARAILYLNDGTGSFSASPNQGFEPMRQGAAEAADVDGDLDLDIVLAGWCNSPAGICHKADLYLNDGSGGYTKNSLSFGSTTFGDHSFADVDGDGDQDLVFSGIERSQGLFETKVYRNDGTGNFLEVPGNDIPISGSSGLIIEDFNRDSKPDILLAGHFQTALYINDGNGVFTEESGLNLFQIARGDINASDMDGDGDPDIILSGDLGQFKSGAYYRNDAVAVSVEGKELTAFRLFPNPAVNAVTIETEFPATVRLYNLQSQLLIEKALQGGKEEVRFKLPPGMYFLQIEERGGRQITRRLKVE